MKIKFIFILFSFFIFNAAFSQLKKLDRIANNFFKVEEFNSALPLYQSLDSISPNNALYNYRIGVCYFNSHYKNRALSYFEKAKKLGIQEPELDIYLAKTYHFNHQFDKAISYYEKYKRIKIDTSLIVNAEEDTKDIRELHDAEKNLDRYIQMCKTGKELLEDSLFLVIENIGNIINGVYPDYVPVVSADENVLLFTSRRASSTGGNIDPTDNHFYEDVYISHKDSSTNQWSAPENMGSHVNSTKHDACIGLSPDGQKLFIYRSTSAKNSSGDIYISTLEGDKWSVPEMMDKKINSPGWEPSATISADEKTIYFSSDRPGGIGGTDIYMIRLLGDTMWSEPINLGPSINTPYNEDAPYIHPDNITLFFSSTGHRNMGGFDIFTSVFDTEKETWSTAENAGYPINTADDDIYFIWSADGTKGYFSSWRENTYGEKDIYIIHRPDGKANLLVMKGRIYDNESKKYLSASITVIDKISGEVLGKFNSNSSNGRFVLTLPHGGNYAVTIETDGYVTQHEDIKVPKKNPFFEVRKDFYLDPIKVGAVIVFNNIFFDFDKSTLRDESNLELKRILGFLKQNEELKIELSGHTDSKGNDKYNLKLSDKRAATVVKYLVKNGIQKDRLVSKGYGESKPIASNDTDEGRQLNRRTELKILDINFKPINQLNDLAINYKNEYGKLDRSGSKNRGSKSKRKSGGDAVKFSSNFESIMANQPVVGSTLFPKVHFVQNAKNALTEYSLKRVEEVALLMKKYPAMRIKIISYAEQSVNESYNKAISKQRAKTVYSLLLSHGISEKRIVQEYYVAFPHLETDDQTTKDLKNRRVEFVVID